MKQLSINLKMLMAERGLNVSELARLTQVAQPVIYRMSTGETDNPKVATLRPLARYFGLSISQLIGDETIPHDTDRDTTDPEPQQWQQIPMLSWQEATDFPSSIATNKERKYIASYHAVPNQQSFALTMQDTTMRPLFPENSLLIFDRSMEAKDRDYILVFISGHKAPLFKQLLLDGETHYLQSLNPAFKTICLDDYPAAHIVGVLIESRMSFDE